MTIRRLDDIVLLEDVCAIEDAERLRLACESGATLIDWSGCNHLHTACFQVMLAARLPVRGQPVNPVLSLWLARFLPIAPSGPAADQAARPATIRQIEA